MIRPQDLTGMWVGGCGDEQAAGRCSFHERHRRPRIHPPSHNAPGKLLDSEREPRGARGSGKGETSCFCESEREANSGCAQWRCTTVLKLLCWIRGERSLTLARNCAQVLCLCPWQLPDENGGTSRVLFETRLTSNLALTFLCMPNSVDNGPPAPSGVM